MTTEHITDDLGYEYVRITAEDGSFVYMTKDAWDAQQEAQSL